MLQSLLKNRVTFPLFKDDGQPFYAENKDLMQHVQILNDKIKSKKYKQITHVCLCGNTTPEKDILLAQKDMWGISVDNYICSKCGLVRSSEIFDDEATAHFYNIDYKPIFYNISTPSANHFVSETERGRQFYDLISSLGLVNEIETVFENGCGMGGNLYPFFTNKKTCTGCDFAKEYVQYGISKGLQLYFGEMNDKDTPDESQDLILLSHVMEHFNDPIEEIIRLTKKIKPGKYLLVEVPGVFAEAPYNYYPTRHLQKAHVFNFFYADFLKLFFEKLGLKVLFANERCTLVLQKPLDYKIPVLPIVMYNHSLASYPQRIKELFIERYVEHEMLNVRNLPIVRRIALFIQRLTK